VLGFIIVLACSPLLSITLAVDLPLKALSTITIYLVDRDL